MLLLGRFWIIFKSFLMSFFLLALPLISLLIASLIALLLLFIGEYNGIQIKSCVSEHISNRSCGGSNAYIIVIVCLVLPILFVIFLSFIEPIMDFLEKVLGE
jgi:hypothetical protein